MLERLRRAARPAATCAIFALAAAFAIALLYSSFCAFTHWKFGTSGDYIRYTNMIWNSGRGNWFAYHAGTQTYLQVHLSFTLALLGPLFYIWDHPFLLSVVQWLMIMAGGTFLVLAGRRQQVPAPYLAGVAVLWCGYHFTQAVQLCEFHSTAGYMLFLPWIYWRLSNDRRQVWLPLLLLAGLREEAALYAVPLLLMEAVRGRWRAGYMYAAACLLYVAVAVGWLYPMLHPRGSDILEARREIFGGRWRDYIENWEPRAIALGWALFPCIAAVGLRAHPFVVLLPLPLIANLSSHWPWQYKLGIHYSANVMASLGIALVDAFARARASHREWQVWARALALVVVTLVSHLTRGFTLGSLRDTGPVYKHINEWGVLALEVAQRFVPKEGILTAPRELLSLAANRRDLFYMNLVEPSATHLEVSVAFLNRNRIPREYLDLLRAGTWGVLYADGLYCVLQKGAPTNRNQTLLENDARPTLFLGTSRKMFGSTRLDPERGAVRYWPGREGAKRKPVVLGAEIDLAPGLHRFTIEFRAGRPPRPGAHAGEFILNDTKAARHVLAVPIDPDPEGVWKIQSLEYRLHAPTRLELQVMGGEIELWLDRAFVVPAEKSSP
ncbi:MAG: DUF2079 domain-containing protein [Kiritimatiellae bacterium]|nr:DUF2079 domain-containing protein [Kiritimatiellia bacterium]MDW8458925.1 DUF2079 domain-containing protein [Verrucomicrobiota bacterium]